MRKEIKKPFSRANPPPTNCNCGARRSSREQAVRPQQVLNTDFDDSTTTGSI